MQAGRGTETRGREDSPGHALRVNIRFEVKGLDFWLLLVPRHILWLPEFSWSTYFSGLGPKPEGGLFRSNPARRRASL